MVIFVSTYYFLIIILNINYCNNEKTKLVRCSSTSVLDLEVLLISSAWWQKCRDQLRLTACNFTAFLFLIHCRTKKRTKKKGKKKKKKNDTITTQTWLKHEYIIKEVKKNHRNSFQHAWKNRLYCIT